MNEEYDRLVDGYHSLCDLMWAVDWEEILKADLPKALRNRIEELHRYSWLMEEMEGIDD